MERAYAQPAEILQHFITCGTRTSERYATSRVWHGFHCTDVHAETIPLTCNLLNEKVHHRGNILFYFIVMYIICFRS